MAGTTTFGLDTLAWLTEHRRANAELIQAASATLPRVEPERSAPALRAELACC